MKFPQVEKIVFVFAADKQIFFYCAGKIARKQQLMKTKKFLFFGLILLSIVRITAQGTLQDSLIAHYTFDNNSLDATPNANHGTLMGPVYGQDRFGNPTGAVFLDGANDYILLQPNNKFKPQLPVTISAWVNISDTDPNLVFWNDWEVDLYHGVWLNIVDGIISAAYGDGNAIGPQSRRSKRGTTVLQTQTWYHLAVVIRGAGDMDIFVNGRNDCGTYSGSGGSLDYSNSPGRMGEIDPLAASGSTHDFFHGSIDDVRFYNRELLTEEIELLAESNFTDTVVNSICLGENVTLSPPSGYNSYSWSPSSDLSCSNCQNPVASPTQSGIYTVVMTRQGGCRDTLYFEVNVAPCCSPFDFQVNAISPPVCTGASNGQFQLTALGATNPVQFSINNGPLQNNNIFTGLQAGAYLVKAIDVNLCEYDTTIVLEDGPPIMLAIDSTRNVPCPGDNLGAIFLSASGGNSPYLFSLTNGAPSTLPFFDSLSVGGYRIVLEDVNGCTASDSVTITGVDGLFTSINSIVSPLCHGDTNGSISLSTSGGTGPYQYVRNGNSTGGNTTLLNLSGGNFVLETIDANGCRIAQIITIPEPSPLSSVISVQAAVSCFDGEDGIGEVLVSGGTLPYSYSWSSGSATNISSGNRSGMALVSITDGNGCMLQDSVFIPQPDSLSAIGVVLEDVRCNGASTGRAFVQITGGTFPYITLWNQTFTGDSVGRLAAGVIPVLVTDANGCMASDTLEILEATEISILVEKVNPGCSDREDGSILAFAGGGTTPYTYSWLSPLVQEGQLLTNIGAGEYLLRITDGNDCTRDSLIQLISPPILDIEILETIPSFCGGNDGEILVSASGGTGTYTFTWNNGVNGPQQTGLFPGNYLVEVEDDNGCTANEFVDLIGSYPVDAIAAIDTSRLPLTEDYPIQFLNLSEGDATYHWALGDGSTSTRPEPIHVYHDIGAYMVILTAYDPDSLCPDRDTLFIDLLDAPRLFVPSGFTPNGDGTNDAFRIGGMQLKGLDLQIYSRWGMLIAELSSPDQTWNGKTFSGYDAPEGVYVFHLKAVMQTGEEIEQSGTITLIR